MWLRACLITEFLCLERHIYHSFTLALFLQAVSDWNSKDNFASTIRTVMIAQKWQRRSVLLHICYGMLKHVLEQNSSHFSDSLNFSSHPDRARIFLFLLFWNQPLPALPKLSPIDEKRADLVTRTLLPWSVLVPLIQAYNILLLSMFLRTMWKEADLSSAMYKHVALVRSTSLISCTCVWGCELGGKGQEKVSVWESKRKLLFIPVTRAEVQNLSSSKHPQQV